MILARVEEVIISGSVNQIGSIKFTPLNSPKPFRKGNKSPILPKAKPLLSSIKQYPVENEIVLIIPGPKTNRRSGGKLDKYYLAPFNIYGSSHHNAQPQALTDEEIQTKTLTGLYNFFKEQENIRPLKPYNGDITIEGRYGQSIRFGSTISGSVETIQENKWSNVGDNPGTPITIIRNGQIGEGEDKAQYDHILEDINGDDSSIYLCSNQQINDFQKAGVSPKEHPSSYKHIIQS
tara:strand:- start:515 stop:1219 length:705 start_codon:yes stop_codon:yes gene_type:complete